MSKLSNIVKRGKIFTRTRVKDQYETILPAKYWQPLQGLLHLSEDVRLQDIPSQREEVLEGDLFAIDGICETVLTVPKKLLIRLMGLKWNINKEEAEYILRQAGMWN